MWDNGNGTDESIAFADLIGIISLILGVKNYKLNVQQSDELMRELYSNQDGMLKTIIKQNEIIIWQNEKLLKELKKMRL